MQQGGKQGKQAAKTNQQRSLQRLKTVVRRLPPDLPEAVFWKSVAPWVIRETDDGEGHEGAEKVAWSEYRPGKIVRSGKDKDSVHSRAYISFHTPEALVAFHRAYDGWSFRDKQGNVAEAVVEFAPYQRLPVAPLKPDPRQGSIDTDTDFLAFQQALTAPQPAEKPEEVMDKAETPKSTPLLDHLRAQKAAELASRKPAIMAPPSLQKKSKGSSEKASKAKGNSSKLVSGENGNGAKAKRKKATAKGARGVANEEIATPGAISEAFPPIGAPTPPPPTAPSTAPLAAPGVAPSVAPAQRQQTRSRPPPQRNAGQSQTQQQPQISLLSRPPTVPSLDPPSPAHSPAISSSNPTPQNVPSNPPQRKPQTPKDTAGQRRQLGAALGAALDKGSKPPRRPNSAAGGAGGPSQVPGNPEQKPSGPSQNAGGRGGHGAGRGRGRGRGGGGPRTDGTAGNSTGRGGAAAAAGSASGGGGSAPVS